MRILNLTEVHWPYGLFAYLQHVVRTYVLTSLTYCLVLRNIYNVWFVIFVVVKGLFKSITVVVKYIVQKKSVHVPKQYNVQVDLYSDDPSVDER